MNDKKFTQASDYIWDNPESGLNEFNTQKIHISLLEEAGFNIEKGISQLETSYLATWGSGSPTIAFLAEMDALEGMSQKADVFVKKPNEKSTCGHGCGHHLLGVGAIAAGIRYKEYLEKNKLKGTVKVFGCPCEESGSGKAYIARDGYFNDCDIAISWHPGLFNIVSTGSSLACIQVYFTFQGKSSHAALAPHLGRSALDAVELMNVGCNYLREHMNMTDRIHYAVLNTGGSNPGIVQPEAEVRYLIRSYDNLDCMDLMTRVIDCAKGAALMTSTTMKFQIEDATSNTIPNTVVENVIRDVFRHSKVPKYTEEEINYLYNYYDKDGAKNLYNMLPPFIKDMVSVKDNIKTKPINDTYVESIISNLVGPASSDVGDVSWNVPTGVVNTACFAYGTNPHSWEWVAQGKSSAAHKGMLYAAKIMLKTAIKFHENPKLIKEARKEFNERLEDKVYKNALPKKVPVNLIRGIK